MTQVIASKLQQLKLAEQTDVEELAFRRKKQHKITGGKRRKSAFNIVASWLERMCASKSSKKNIFVSVIIQPHPMLV